MSTAITIQGESSSTHYRGLAPACSILDLTVAELRDRARLLGVRMIDLIPD